MLGQQTIFFIDSLRPVVQLPVITYKKAVMYYLLGVACGVVITMSLLFAILRNVSYAYAAGIAHSVQISTQKNNIFGEFCERTGHDDEFRLIFERLNDKDQQSLMLLVGTNMEQAIPAIAKAAYTYNIPVAFTTGIANAESGIHEHYYLESDKDTCYNPWGLKPPQGVREDGSYLICFDNWEASTEHFNKLLRERYFDYGARTIKSIAPYYKCGGWDGSEGCLSTLDNWIYNVSQFGYF